jgi:hypothetical protein
VPIIFESSSLPDAPVAGADASLECPFTWRDLIAVVEPLLPPALGSGLTNRLYEASPGVKSAGGARVALG